MLAPNGIDFGPCCACEGTKDVRNLMFLSLELPAEAHGTGWGCFACNLPSNGAMAVLCDRCVDENREPRFAILGDVSKHQRIAIAGLKPFEHKPEPHVTDFLQGHMPGDPMVKLIAEALKKTNPGLYRTLDRLIWSGQSKVQILKHIQRMQRIEPYSLLDNLIHVTLDYLEVEYRAALDAMAKGGPSARIIPAQGGDETGIQCLRCSAVSFNPNDITNQFCGFCKIFHDNVITVT